jgi:hypothetical protein
LSCCGIQGRHIAILADPLRPESAFTRGPC